MRRLRDKINIPGDYQHKAVLEGHRIQRFWHMTKQWAIQDLLPPKSNELVLDVGCGSGVIASFLGNYGARVVGIDSNPEAIEYARKTFANDNVSFRLGYVDEQFVINEPVDKIYCLEVIEHIYEQQAVDMLRGFYRILKPKGKVLLTTPNYRSLWPLIEWALDTTGLVPTMDRLQHVTHYNISKIKQLTVKTGFCIEKIIKICFIAPWVSVLGWSFAKRLYYLENKLSFLPGSIIVCIMKKGSSSNI